MTYGEAVVIDLPDGPIFALLTLGDGQQPFGYVVSTALDPGMLPNIDGYLATIRKLASSKVKVLLPRHWLSRPTDKGWPILVRFRDLNDPKTVELVDPDTIGVTRIIVETTNDALTSGVANRLPWLRSVKDQFDSISGTVSPGFSLTARQFSFHK